MICQPVTSFRARVAALAALIATVLALTTLPASAQGTDMAVPMTPQAVGLKKVLEQKFPGAEIRGVVKTPYFGLYEVMFDDRIVYTDAKAKYVLIGAVYDTESKTNLTEERQRKQNRVNVAALPLDLAIKKVKGNGERKLVVFSDPDCPFCAQLEKTLKNVDNTTVYTFLFPIDQLHPDAARKSRMIWCAPDRVKCVGCPLRFRNAARQLGRLRESGGEDPGTRCQLEDQRHSHPHLCGRVDCAGSDCRRKGSKPNSRRRTLGCGRWRQARSKDSTADHRGSRATKRAAERDIAASSTASIAQHAALVNRWWIISLVVIVLDQASKRMIQTTPPYGASIPVTGFFNVFHAWVTGAAFSLLANQSGWQRYFVIVLAIVVSAVLGWLLRKPLPMDGRRKSKAASIDRSPVPRLSASCCAKEVDLG